MRNACRILLALAAILAGVSHLAYGLYFFALFREFRQQPCPCAKEVAVAGLLSFEEVIPDPGGHPPLLDCKIPILTLALCLLAFCLHAALGCQPWGRAHLLGVGLWLAGLAFLVWSCLISQGIAG